VRRVGHKYVLENPYIPAERRVNATRRIRGIVGRVEVGDEVRTLHLKRAVYGKVMEINRWKRKHMARVVGEHYPGGPSVETRADVENLAITWKNTEGLWQT
jgi:hypothetical protein